jgi:hypothetical protein
VEKKRGLKEVFIETKDARLWAINKMWVHDRLLAPAGLNEKSS